MKQQIIVIHGGTAWSTHEAYVRYLEQYPLERILQKSDKRWKDLLPEAMGDNYELIMPSMPSSQNAKYAEWKIWFEKFMPLLHDDLVLIGHSMGGIFLAKYLLENELPVTVKHLHLVAAPIEDPPAGEAGTPEESLSDFNFADAEKLPELAEKVHEIIIYHSEDDPVVPFKDAVAYAHYLKNAEFVRFLDRGHFLDEEFPELIARIKN